MFETAFIRLLEESVGAENASIALQALSGESSCSIRLNPSKLRECPFDGAEAVPWSPWGFFLKNRPVFTLDPLFHAGCYYVQESSAMMVGHVFRRVCESLEEGAAVLDLCAAPGGKSTDIAASLRERLGDRFSLLSNEVMKNRVGVLRSNMESWGDPSTGVVSKDPSAFGNEGVFDAILADVPCSGEGMFRKDSEALRMWNADLPAFCSARSKRILSDIWPALKPGGILIYSTCTFNHLENDDTAEWICRELGASPLDPGDCHPALETRYGRLMLPGLVPGEGQYVCALRKNGKSGVGRTCDIFRTFGAGRIMTPEENSPLVDVSRADALKYLHGDSIILPPDAPLGPVTISFAGHALGPGKNLGKRCNNLYPKNKRIRMSI